MLELPKKLKAEVLFLAAFNASNNNRPELANNWYKKSYNLTQNPRLKAKSLFFRSILPLRNRKFGKAEGLLKKILPLKEPEAMEYRDLALLSLGRIAVH